MANKPHFDAEFRKKAEYLSFVARKMLAGLLHGSGPSPRKGHTIEFDDFRSYAPGDDFRDIDWNIFRRLDTLFVKLFKGEQNIRLTVLLDVSASMDYGSQNKLVYAKQLAAALAYIGLTHLDRVDIIPFAENLHEGLHGLVGRRNIERLLDYLQRLEPGGATNLSNVFRSYVTSNRKRGLILVISDVFDLEGYPTAFRYLRSQQHNVYVLHVIDADEQAPSLTGIARLTDSESGQVREFTLTDRLLTRYRHLFEGHCKAVEHFCRARDIGYVGARTEIPFDELILRVLRKGEFIR